MITILLIANIDDPEPQNPVVATLIATGATSQNLCWMMLLFQTLLIWQLLHQQWQGNWSKADAEEKDNT